MPVVYPIKDGVTEEDYIKWQKENMRRVPLDVRRDYYDEVLKPSADKAGETVGGYIKKAINERIEREKKTDKVP